MKRKLPPGYQKHPAPEGIKTLDSIKISARHSGILHAGQYTDKKPPPNIKVNINATSKTSVEYEEVKVGNEKRYALIYRINNYNDSLAFADLEVIK